MEKTRTYQEAYFDFIVKSDMTAYTEFRELLKIQYPEFTDQEVFDKIEIYLIDAISEIMTKRKQGQTK